MTVLLLLQLQNNTVFTISLLCRGIPFINTWNFNYMDRSRLVHRGSFDQQRGGTHTIGGSGETILEKQRRILFEREIRLKKKLYAIRKQREHVRHDRQKRHVPTVAVVGYTNAGIE